MLAEEANCIFVSSGRPINVNFIGAMNPWATLIFSANEVCPLGSASHVR